MSKAYLFLVKGFLIQSNILIIPFQIQITKPLQSNLCLKDFLKHTHPIFFLWHVELRPFHFSDARLMAVENHSLHPTTSKLTHARTQDLVPTHAPHLAVVGYSPLQQVSRHTLKSIRYADLNKCIIYYFLEKPTRPTTS